MKKYILYHLPWQFLMALIYVQSNISQIPIPNLGITWQDKLLHFSVFGVVAFLLCRSLKRSGIKLIEKFYLPWAVSLTSVYGIFDEFHQYFVIGRYSTFADWAADTIGAIFFVLVYYLIEKNSKGNLRKVL